MPVEADVDDRRAPDAGDRGGRLLRRRRGADQRRQVRAGRRGARSSSGATGDGVDGRRRRRRRRRRRHRAAAPACAGCSTGSPRSTGGSTIDSAGRRGHAAAGADPGVIRLRRAACSRSPCWRAAARSPRSASPTSSPAAPRRPRRGGRRRTAGRVRIAVVTHGQASSAFWAIVRNGVDAAAADDVPVSYRSPDISTSARWRADRRGGRLAARRARRLDPRARARARRSAAPCGPASRSCRSTRAPTVRALGMLAHVGQPEARAGLEAGGGSRGAGVRSALCINQELGNNALDRRCAGFARAMRAAGGAPRVLDVDDQDRATPRRRLAAAISPARRDGVLALTTPAASAAADAVPRDGALIGHLRPHARGPRGDQGRADAVRGRPAGLPPGLHADRDAGPAGPLRPLPGAGRRGARPGRTSSRAANAAQAERLSLQGIR